MPLPDLHNTIAGAAQSLRTAYGPTGRDVLPQEIVELLTRLETQPAVRNDYFEVLPARQPDNPAADWHLAQFWTGRVIAGQEHRLIGTTAEPGSAVNAHIPMFTWYRHTAVVAGEWDPDIVDHRFRFMKTYIKPNADVEQHAIELAKKRRTADEQQQDAVNRLFAHMITHELVHIIAHWGGAEELKPFALDAEQVGQTVPEWQQTQRMRVCEEGVPEILTRWARDVTLDQVGYSYDAEAAFWNASLGLRWRFALSLPEEDNFTTLDMRTALLNAYFRGSSATAFGNGWDWFLYNFKCFIDRFATPQLAFGH